jgi:DNA invertase Pin-like site-specific DNA recombinase
LIAPVNPRDAIQERTMAGMTSVRRRGCLLDRPKGLTKSAKQKAQLAESLYKDENFSVKQFAKKLRISKTTLYKYLRFRGIKIG